MLQCISGVLIVIGLSLKVFNLANTVSFGTYTGTQTRSSSSVAGDGLSEMVEQLRQEFAAIQEDFVEHSAVHRSNFTHIHNKLLLLQDTIDDITQTTEPPLSPLNTVEPGLSIQSLIPTH